MKNIFFSTVFFFTLCNLSFGSGFTTLTKSDSLKKAKFQILQLQSYEDNLLGYTFESDDKPFADFTLSFRARIFPFDYLMNILPKKYRQDLHLQFAFTGRFGQYIGTRYSNPVVEKRFNPYLFFEFFPKNKFRNISLSVGYGHESNGQAIDDSATFYKTAALPNNTVKETRDKISRGWDYYGTTIKADIFPKKYPKLIFETDVTVKYFLDKGLLQGWKEEYHSWEQDWRGANYSRNNVTGISVAITCLIDSSFFNKIRISYETGFIQPFVTNSVKLQLGFKIGNFPLSFSYRYGYNGDLAQYGKSNSSFGIESLIPSFIRPEDKRKK